jgi:phosphoglycerate dehydrogenase-like enzyme
MRVLALRRHPAPDEFAHEVWGPERLDEVLRECDYLLVSCALTEQTRGMIGARELGLMKPDAVIVNVARGAVIDSAALLDALRERRIGGAGLDVTDPEPLPADSPLWHMDNVIITPHVSGSSPETSRRQFELLEENVRRFAAGEELLNVVDKMAGY